MKNLPEYLESVVNSVLEESKLGESKTFYSLSKSDQALVVTYLSTLLDSDVSTKAQHYDEVPVDIETFVYDDLYLGKVLGQHIYPRWIDHMKVFLAPDSRYIEVIFTGAIGIGKTTIAIASQLYHLYKLLCLKDPQTYNGLIPGTEIIFALFNITLDLSEDVGFSNIRNMITHSEYFKSTLVFNPRSPDSIIFPKNLSVKVGSKFTHALGQAVYSAILDEANFDTAGGLDSKVSKVIKTYNTIYRRMESRFMQAGGNIPGQLYLVSSKNEVNSFLEVHIKESIKSSTTYVVDEPQWKFKEHKGIYSGVNFRVMIGDSRIQSKILDITDNPPFGYEIVEVPIEYKESFERDIDSSIKDIIGKTISSTRKLIINKDRVYSCVKKTIGTTDEIWRNPFSSNILELDFDDDELTIESYLDVPYFTSYLNIIGKSKPRWVHLDLSISGDRLGFCMGHISDHKAVSLMDDTFNIETVIKETYGIDIMFGVKPLKHKEIPIYQIPRFIIFLREKLGINIVGISTDGYQSSVLRQIFKKMDIKKVSLLSVDRTDVPYITLKDSFLDSRVEMYEYFPVLVELFDLIHDTENHKVDHPQYNSYGEKGSKDISDSLCGCITSLLTMTEKFEDDINFVAMDPSPDIGEDSIEAEKQELFKFAIGDYT